MDGPLRAALRRTTLRLLLAAPLVLLGLHAAGPWALRHAEPMLLTLCRWAAPDFDWRRVALIDGRAGPRLHAQVGLARTVIVGGRAILPDPRGRAQARWPAQRALHGVALALLLVLAWPAAGRIEALLRAALALPATIALLAADLPWSLAAEFWRLLLAAHDPGGTHPVVAWAEALDAGARPLLGLLAGAVVLVAARAASGAVEPGRSDHGARHRHDSPAADTAPHPGADHRIR